MIEEASIEDVDALTELAERAYEQSAYTQYPFSKIAVRRMAVLGVTMPGFLLLKSTHGEGINGFLLGGISENLFGAVMAQTHALFVEKPGDGIHMLKRFLRWADERNVHGVIVGSTHSNERYERALALMGLTRVGGIYTR